KDARALVRPDAGGQPVRRVVRLFHSLVRSPERENREHRAEYLFPRYAVRLRHIGEKRRREPESALGQDALGLVQLGAFFTPRLDQALDLFQLGARVDGADVGVLVKWVAQATGREPSLQLLKQRLGNRLLHQ